MLLPVHPFSVRRLREFIEHCEALGDDSEYRSCTTIAQTVDVFLTRRGIRIPRPADLWNMLYNTDWRVAPRLLSELLMGLQFMLVGMGMCTINMAAGRYHRSQEILAHSLDFTHRYQRLVHMDIFATRLLTTYAAGLHLHPHNWNVPEIGTDARLRAHLQSLYDRVARDCEVYWPVANMVMREEIVALEYVSGSELPSACVNWSQCGGIEQLALPGLPPCVAGFVFQHEQPGDRERWLYSSVGREPPCDFIGVSLWDSDVSAHTLADDTCFSYCHHAALEPAEPFSQFPICLDE